MEQSFFQVKILSKTMLTPDIMILRLEKPIGFSFTPGQFVQFKVPQPEGFVLRSYSIASHPAEQHLEFCVKILPEGKASHYFVGREQGETVEISAAKGTFICKPDHSAQKVFIATGAGIAPIMSMIKDRLQAGDTIELLFGLRSDSDVFWVDEFERFKNEHSHFNYFITLSQPSSDWSGITGRVTAHVPSVSPPANYYMCGSVDMVKEMRALLLARGTDSKCVHFEIF